MPGAHNWYVLVVIIDGVWNCKLSVWPMCFYFELYVSKHGPEKTKTFIHCSAEISPSKQA